MATLTPEAKKLLSQTIRGLRERLLRDIRDEAERRYHLSVPLQKAGLDEALRKNRERLESWLDERVRAASPKKDKSAARERFLGQAVKEAGATLVNRLALIRHLEAMGLSKPHVVTGGWNSKGYQEWRDFAPALLDDDAEGYATLLQLIFDELGVDLPGLFGDVGLTRLFPVPPATLREVITQLDDKELESAWTDDTTLGWIYQYWNDPERESLDAKINAGGKIEPHEIASKTQMFTERYRTRRTIPCLRDSTLKLSRSPTGYPPRRRYVRSCASCTLASCSIALTSTTTRPSTRKSSRKCASSSSPSYLTGNHTSRANRTCRRRSSIASAAQYTDSSNPGPSRR